MRKGVRCLGRAADLKLEHWHAKPLVTSEDSSEKSAPVPRGHVMYLCISFVFVYFNLMAMLGRLLPASNLRTPWEAIAGPRTPFSASELGLRFYILENMQMKWRLDSAVLLVVARFFRSGTRLK